MLLNAARSLLLIVDIQEKLAPAIHEGAAAIANNRRLLAAAAQLKVPVVVTEQYVRGLGPTVADLQPWLQQATVDVEKIEKIHFGACGEPGFVAGLQARQRPQIVITGMETHVCVLQTALGLLAAGFEVYLVADAASSRTPENKAAALARLQAAGARIVTTEMVIFEWLERAGTADFRALLPQIK
jgi:nicotinamidase-related amidase